MRSIGWRTKRGVVMQLVLLSLVLLAACRPMEGGGEVLMPGGEEGSREAAGAVSLLIFGRISPDSLALEPIFRIDAPASLPHGTEEGHRLLGFDEAGARLFELRFSGAPVAALPAEEHFSVVVAVSEAQAARLARVELMAADGRRLVRTATLSNEAFAAALRADDVVGARRRAGGVVQLRWNAAVFPMVMVRDPETREVLSFARGGEVTIRTEREVLEVTLSEGVRSGVRQVRVRS
jgi:hypothetical protein